MATASITLTRAWLMDPLDPTNPIIAGSSGSIGGGARNNTKAKDGDYRTYVGRVRMVVRPTTASTYQIALRNLTKDQGDKVEGWAGKLLLLRDIYGRRVWGSYLSTQRLEYVGGKGLCDVSFTFTEVTYSDEV
jgi:hypothetical protein